MANTQRGEIELKVGDKTHILRLGVNAIAEIESLLDKGVNEIVATLQGDGMRLGSLRAIMWGGLREHWPDVTLMEVGDLIEEIGADVAGQKIGDALKASFPDPDHNSPPPTGQAGTGQPS